MDPKERCRFARRKELVLRGVLDERAAQVVVDVAHVDEPSAGGVACAAEGARERRVFDQGGDEDGLTGLDVRADAGDQVGVAIEAFHPR